MKEPRNHLRRDIERWRYLDALDAGDLETVGALWDQASHDPELEILLAELEGELVQEQGEPICKTDHEREQARPPEPMPGRFPTPQPSLAYSACDRTEKRPIDVLHGNVDPGADHQANARHTGSRNSLSAHPGQGRRPWVVRVGVFAGAAAACLLAVFAWLGRDGTNTVPSRGTSDIAGQDTVPRPEPNKSSHQVTLRPPGDSAGVAAWLETRRVLVGAPPPTFVWPVRETLSTRVSISIPADPLD